MNDQLLHPETIRLEAFARGELEPSEIDAVQRHLADCQSCCHALDEVPDDKLLALVRRAGTAVDADETMVAPKDQTANDASLPGTDETVVGESVALRSVADLPTELAEHTRYRVLDLIGKGGMGDVYRAEHRMMQRMVALKVIKRELTENPQAVERFQREVRAAASLTHGNIVAAYDAEQAGEIHFLAMEFVEGTDLANIVKSHGALPVGEACEYIRQAAIGLQHAHEKGMVHRDIKPHNLMITGDGTVKILDFGLASLTEGPIDGGAAAGPGDLTAVGAIMGTPDYISPEQATDPRSVDIRSDIYSLGATLYFLLAGRPPFDEGSVVEKLKSHAELEAVPIDSIRGDVPKEVAEVIARMMSRDPAERFETPSELADVLASFVEKHRTDIPAVQPGKRAKFWPYVALAALLLVVAASGVVLYVATDKGTSTVSRKAHELPPPPPPTAIKTLNNMKLVLIPPGEFMMGTTGLEKGNPIEQQHRVEITKPFYMGVHEVTQQEYEWVMGKNPSGFSATGDRKDLVSDQDTNRFPVESVSWEDATEFCRRLSALPEARRAGHVYRLPTEAEWEYACRAGTTTTFYFGDGLNGTHANVDGKHPWGMSEKGPSLKRTTVVGSYGPNAFGLYDMHGNVWEWCSDWYVIDYYANSPRSDPPGPTSGSSRVVRGGAWDWGALHARCAARAQRAPDYLDQNLGFRVVRVTVNEDAESRQVQAKKQHAKGPGPDSADSREEPKKTKTTTNSIGKTVTILAGSMKGYSLGPVTRSSTIHLQYVNGKWKGWDRRADICPDKTDGRGEGSCHLAIVAFPGKASSGDVVQVVPEGTSEKPFLYHVDRDFDELVLRINYNDGNWNDNPGQVQYKVQVQPP